MHTTARIAKKLVGSLGIVIATAAAFAVVDDGTRTTSEVALIVFALGTTVIIVGLLSRLVQTREGRIGAATSTVSDEVERLARLRANGALTDEEFAEAKRRVLGL